MFPVLHDQRPKRPTQGCLCDLCQLYLCICISNISDFGPPVSALGSRSSPDRGLLQQFKTPLHNSSSLLLGAFFSYSFCCFFVFYELIIFIKVMRDLLPVILYGFLCYHFFFGNLLHTPSLCDTLQFFNGYESHFGGPWPAPVRPTSHCIYLYLHLCLSLFLAVPLHSRFRFRPHFISLANRSKLVCKVRCLSQLLGLIRSRLV